MKRKDLSSLHRSPPTESENGAPEGTKLGVWVGLLVEGTVLGHFDGGSVGLVDGRNIGEALGFDVGLPLGDELGDTEGLKLGA